MKLKYRKNQAIRIIANDIAIYSTVGNYARTLGNGWTINAALLALLELQEKNARGIATSYQGKSIQVDILD